MYILPNYISYKPNHLFNKEKSVQCHNKSTLLLTKYTNCNRKYNVDNGFLATVLWNNMMQFHQSVWLILSFNPNCFYITVFRNILDDVGNQSSMGNTSKKRRRNNTSNQDSITDQLEQRCIINGSNNLWVCANATNSRHSCVFCKYMDAIWVIKSCRYKM